MTETEFNRLVDETLIEIEQIIERLDTDIDFDTIAGVLTLEFENGSKIILSRQSAIKQLWVATVAGGFHFSYVDGAWLEEHRNIALLPFLQQSCSAQAGEPVVFE